MYTGIVSFVLFDARGTLMQSHCLVALGIVLANIGLKYIPRIFHRPQLTDQMCQDLIHVSVHACGVSIIASPLLKYACSVHSACFLLESRCNPSIFNQTIIALCLAAAYFYGPRITDVQTFITAVGMPHLLGVVGQGLVYVHQLLVFWLLEF